MPIPDLSGKKILVAPLDWGLGHATRSMPIIDQLLEWNAAVIIAGSGRSLHLLREEYSELEHVELPSYNVRYTTGTAMVAMTLAMIPNYLMAIYREHRALNRLIREKGIDMVISDNRYGMWSSKVPTAFMCHQISVIPPSIIKWSMPVAYRLHRLFLDRFDEVWIPDLESTSNLSGVLSHKYAPTSRMRYIGPMSRFQGKASQGNGGNEVLVVLSGPEPQRTVLEEKIKAQAIQIDRKFTIVQGMTEVLSESAEQNVRIVSFMNAGQLEEAFSNADVVVARSGYSTIMDLFALGKKAVFIPTPGQTEQEYLAEQLAAQGLAVVQDQSELDLDAAIKKTSFIKGFPKMDANNRYKEVIAEFVERML